jgi:type I restriction enzyme S subunit
MENGKSAVAEKLENGFGFGSTEFHVFRPKDSGLRVHYLHALFRMALVREHARLFFGGSSGHQRVDEAYFNRLEIPFPPVQVLEKIADEIKKVRAAAHALRRQATAELATAKKSIETMILGKDGKP